MDKKAIYITAKFENAVIEYARTLLEQEAGEAITKEAAREVVHNISRPIHKTPEKPYIWPKVPPAPGRK